jgi:nucleoside triphosphate diphosphatase
MEQNQYDADRAALAAAFLDLVDVMAALRDPQNGCPWDMEQDFASIAPYTIEEAYEVAEAIRKQDWPELREELGDLLFQVVFHARMASEVQHFDLRDVCLAIVSKMRRRHPHVFGMAATRTADEQTKAWETIKANERAAKSLSSNSALEGVALALPAAKRAQKLQQRAARVGFDWPSPAGAKAKIFEELDEIEAAQASKDSGAIAEEAGDLLFAAINYIRLLGIDAETALGAASSKFEGRFRAMEDLSETPLDGQSLEALEGLWVQVKKLL